MSYLPAFVGRSPDLQEEIMAGIISATVGMYVDPLYIIELLISLGFYLRNFTLIH